MHLKLLTKREREGLKIAFFPLLHLASLVKEGVGGAVQVKLVFSV